MPFRLSVAELDAPFPLFSGEARPVALMLIVPSCFSWSAVVSVGASANAETASSSSASKFRRFWNAIRFTFPGAFVAWREVYQCSYVETHMFHAKTRYGALPASLEHCVTVGALC